MTAEQRTIPGGDLPVRPVTVPDPATDVGSEPMHPLPEPVLMDRRWMGGLGWRLLGVALSIPLIFAVVFCLALLGRDVEAPSWLKAEVEARAGQLLDGGSISFGRMRLTLGTDLHPRVVLGNARMRDRDGALIAEVPRLTALLSPRGVLRGDVLVQEVDLSAVQIALRRSSTGDVSLEIGNARAGGAKGRAAEASDTSGFAGLLDDLDAALEAPRLAALEQIRVTGLIVNYADARAGRSWTVDGGRLLLDLRGDAVVLKGDVSLLSGRAYLTELSLDYQSANGTRASEIALSIKDGIAADLASQSPALSWLSVIDAPLSADLSGRIDEDGGLGPLTASLRLGAGALQPTETTRPIPFDSAEARLVFDPVTASLDFEHLALDSPWGQLSATGKSWLRDWSNGFPERLLAQFSFSQVEVNPGGVFDRPRALGAADLVFRLTLEPFLVEIGELSLRQDASRTTVRGTVAAEPEGWAVRSDFRLTNTETDAVLDLWPVSLRPNTREWFARNLTAGLISRASGVFRMSPEAEPRFGASFEFSDLDLRYMRTFPPIQAAAGHGIWERGELTISLDQGAITAPQGGALNIAGSVFSIPDLRVKDPPANVSLSTRGTLTAVLSTLDLPPFEFLSKADLPVSLADARVAARGSLSLPLMERIPRDSILYSVDATVRDARSDVLIPGRQFASTGLNVRADNGGLEVSGPVRVGQVPMTARFNQAFVDNGARAAQVTADVEISERFLDEFRIALPPGMLQGDGDGQLRLDLAAGRAPEFRLTSTLAGLRLALPSLGWVKPASARGRFAISGRLGATPDIDRLSLEAPGLSASGDLDIGNNGRLIGARFGELRVGDWLSTAVQLRDRGEGRPMGVTLSGGRLDLRRAEFESTGGPSPPMAMDLDRLVVSENISLTGFSGEFTGGDGLSGQFSARVNGGGAIRGTAIPREAGRTAVRVIAEDAGAVLSSAGLMRNARGGALELTLLPTGGEGTFDGDMSIRDIRVKDVPALAGLLDAISVVGLLQQLDGQGLAFSEVDARFRIDPNRLVVAESSAIGASLGISLDGTYLTATKEMDFQGVVSPFYLLNGIGAVLTRPGEGLIGFNVTLRGAPDAPRISVNPLSVFTPGMFREIFRRPPPELDQ